MRPTIGDARRGRRRCRSLARRSPRRGGRSTVRRRDAASGSSSVSAASGSRRAAQQRRSSSDPGARSIGPPCRSAGTAAIAARGFALDLEHRGERRDRRGAALGLGGEARHAGGVAVAAVALVAHHLAVDELDDAPLHLVDEAGLVRGHDDRRAARVDAREQLHDVDGCRRVEVSGRLVGEQHLRAVHERPRDRDALLLTAGQLVREPLVLAGEADEREHLGHGLLDESARRADDLQRERDVLEDRLVRQQPEVLEHRADVPAEVRHLAVGQRAAGRGRARRRGRRSASPRAGSVAGTMDLPEPEAPTRKTNSPRSTSKSTSLRAGLAVPRIALRDVLEPDHGHHEPKRAGARHPERHPGIGIRSSSFSDGSGRRAEERPRWTGRSSSVRSYERIRVHLLTGLSVRLPLLMVSDECLVAAGRRCPAAPGWCCRS